MKNSNILAVDAMGGDFGPSVVVPGALKAGQKCGAKILLVGIESAIQEVLDTLPDDLKKVDFSIVHASQVVDMHEKPSDILRQKKDSSIQVACRLVKEGNAHSVISA
ncbi:MAG: phosphate--acyl-ACP acyltransferase, partial [Mailhella sp.]|nr:phosphate--acyl-ACP acyltransferase [Mailhella sp.]